MTRAPTDTDPRGLHRAAATLAATQLARANGSVEQATAAAVRQASRGEDWRRAACLLGGIDDSVTHDSGYEMGAYAAKIAETFLENTNNPTTAAKKLRPLIGDGPVWLRAFLLLKGAEEARRRMNIALAH